MKSIKEAINAVVTAGPKGRFLLIGTPGIGKTKALTSALEADGYETILWPCQLLMIESIGSIPVLKKTDHAGSTVEFAVSSDIAKACDPSKKIAIILDELLKSSPDVLSALMPLAYDREVWGRKLAPNTIVVSTSNSAEIMVGDKPKPHTLGRLTQVSVRPPAPDEWAADFAIPAGLDPRIIDWCRNNPQALVGYDAAQANEKASKASYYFGYQPSNPWQPYCTARSLVQASELLTLGLESFIDGAIGPAAAASLSAHLRDAGATPDIASILASPKNYPVPQKVLNQRLIAIALSQQVITQKTEDIKTFYLNCWDYISRCHAEVQMIFVNDIRTSSIKLELMSKSQEYCQHIKTCLTV